MLPALLDGFARQNPLMIVRRAGQHVAGELYVIRPEFYDDVLADCDQLEGIPAGATAGNRYRRIRVTVETAEGKTAAWAYGHRDTPAI